MQPESDRREVVVTDVDMPFLSMVRFMVKWAIASIPAMVILVVIGATVGAFATGFITSLLFGPPHGVSGRRSAAPSGPVTEESRVYLDGPNRLFHTLDCPDAQILSSRMEYTAGGAKANGYAPHACIYER